MAKLKNTEINGELSLGNDGYVDIVTNNSLIMKSNDSAGGLLTNRLLFSNNIAIGTGSNVITTGTASDVTITVPYSDIFSGLTNYTVNNLTSPSTKVYIPSFTFSKSFSWEANANHSNNTFNITFCFEFWVKGNEVNTTTPNNTDYLVYYATVPATVTGIYSSLIYGESSNGSFTFSSGTVGPFNIPVTSFSKNTSWFAYNASDPASIPTNVNLSSIRFSLKDVYKGTTTNTNLKMNVDSSNFSSDFAATIGVFSAPNNNITIGNSSSATGSNSIAIGYGAKTNGGTNIGAGDQSDNEYLYLGVNGIPWANKTGSSAAWANGSDYRDKTDFQDITNGLEFIKSLNPITYVMNDRYFYNNEDGTFDEEGYLQGTKKKHRRHAGFKAQDVYDSLLNIYKNDNYAAIVDYTKYDNKNNSFDKYYMRYEYLIPFLVDAIKTQNKMIEDLQEEIENLKKR